MSVFSSAPPPDGRSTHHQHRLDAPPGGARQASHHRHSPEQPSGEVEEEVDDEQEDDEDVSSRRSLSSLVDESVHTFRNYDNSARQHNVAALYKQQHEQMTYDVVMAQHRQHLKFDKVRMTMWEAIEYLDTMVDDSDPDTESSQTQHALQSAEASRRKFPELDWLHLVCLVHDCGKLLAVDDAERGLVASPQWLVVGDTFPVGCRFEETNVLQHLFAGNPDSHHPVYSTKFGVYEPHCGLNNLTMSWGHDEYLYQVLLHNHTALPPVALAIIRFHSFYPWHNCGGYQHLTNEADQSTLEWVKTFNEFDLYSKTDELQDVDALKHYYIGLIDKYIPGPLQW